MAVVTILLLVVGALAGYLVGSISFAAIVGRFVVPAADLSKTRVALPEGPEIEMDGISATSVSMSAGRRWGCLVSILDIAKAALVTLAFRYAFPDEPADLAAAGFAVVGHIWPLWHRFHGGFGISPMLGGVGAVDPLALVVTLPLGMLVGFVRRDQMLMVDGWTLFLIPWFIFRGSLAEVAYAVAIVALYWSRTWRIRHELHQREGAAPSP